MDTVQIVNCLKALLHPDAAMRSTAEHTLGLLQTHHEYSAALLNIAMTSQDKAVILSSAIALKDSQRKQDVNIHNQILKVLLKNKEDSSIWYDFLISGKPSKKCCSKLCALIIRNIGLI